MRILRHIFLCFCGILWAGQTLAFTDATQGIGLWQDLPFARVRLISCTSGIQNRSRIVGGLQVKVKQNWQIKRPTLKTLQTDIPTVIDYPVVPNRFNTTHYTQDFFIPVLYDISHARNPIHYGVQGILEGCRPDMCLNLPIQMELPLSRGESEYTSVCAYITNQLGLIPNPDKSVKAKGQWLDNHSAWIEFSGPEGVEQVFLQNQSGLDFQVLEMHLQKQSIRFRVSYVQENPRNTIQDWILITNKGIFRVPVVLGMEPLPMPVTEKPWLLWIISGLICFICGPFFIFWGLMIPKGQQALQKQSKRTLIWICGAVIGWGCLSAYPIWDHFFIIILLLMGLTLFYPPKNGLWAGLLFLIWPKPYLNTLLDSFPLGVVLLGLMIGQSLPFILMYKYAAVWGKKLRHSLVKDTFHHNLFFLLPTLCLMVWGWVNCPVMIPYHNALNTDKIMVVCSGKECQKWMETSLPIQLIDKKSTLGQMLQQRYQHPQLILFYDQEQWVIIDSITPAQLKRFLINWHNYHVAGTPEYPPVHFRDVPHAP